MNLGVCSEIAEPTPSFPWAGIEVWMYEFEDSLGVVPEWRLDLSENSAGDCYIEEWKSQCEGSLYCNTISMGHFRLMFSSVKPLD